MAVLNDFEQNQLARKEEKLSEAFLKELEPYLEKYKNMSDEALKQTKESLQKAYQNGASEEDIRLETFAAYNEAFARNFKDQGHKLYETQLETSYLLSKEYLAEVKTGEGKTFAIGPKAVMDVVLGHKVMSYTANEYLASRDNEKTKDIYDMLGIKSDYLTPDNFEERKQEIIADKTISSKSKMEKIKKIKETIRKEKEEAYTADIINTTTSSFGFDYLKDSRVEVKEDRRIPFKLENVRNIIDEVDSVLIDDVKNGLVLSDSSSENSEIISFAAKVMQQLKITDESRNVNKEQDVFIVDNHDEMMEACENRGSMSYLIFDEKTKDYIFTDKGEKYLIDQFDKAGLLNDPNDKLSKGDIYAKDYMNYVENAAKAQFCLSDKKDDYRIIDDEIILMDKNTGRTKIGSRLSDGLHQALEAKHELEIKPFSDTVIGMDLASFFGQCNQTTGVSGSIKTSSEEFSKIYGKKIVAVKPHVVKEDEKMAKLRGTKSTFISEKGNYDLNLYGTKEQKYKEILRSVKLAVSKKQPILVNAENIEESAEISKFLSENGISNNLLNAENKKEEAKIIEKGGIAGAVTVATAMAGRGTDIQIDDQAREAGGLFVLGTYAPDSIRITTQVVGRTRRDRDPGASKFIVSLEDDFFKNNCIPAEISKLGTKIINNHDAKKEVESIQNRIELDAFMGRKQRSEYAELESGIVIELNKLRDDVLDNDNFSMINFDLSEDTLSKANKEKLSKLKSQIDVLDFSNKNIVDITRKALINAIDETRIDFFTSKSQIYSTVQMRGSYNENYNPLMEYHMQLIEFIDDSFFNNMSDAVLSIKQTISEESKEKEVNQEENEFQKLLTDISNCNDEQELDNIFKSAMMANLNFKLKPDEFKILNTKILKLRISYKKQAKVEFDSKTSENSFSEYMDLVIQGNPDLKQLVIIEDNIQKSTALTEGERDAIKALINEAQENLVDTQSYNKKV